VLSSSIPIIAFSPIMVFWFGFQWPSKAAVVLVLCFFPMLINTTVGLTSYSPLSRDLLISYAASGWTVFRKLQFPAALPMVFNGLKICSTLSVIGATVAEYFSSLGKGLGSQIQDGASAAAWDLVWACVFAACAVGIIFYAVLLVLERLFTFWHVSYRAST
jgi:NitT/TauT family transport system permease protein